MKRIILTIAAAAFLVSCSHDESESIPEVNNQDMTLLSPQQKEYVNKNNDFAIGLYKKVAVKADENVVMSPLSATFALGMLNNGAAGQTLEEISRGLGFGGGNASAVNDFCRKIWKGAQQSDNTTSVDMANAILMNQPYELQKEFKDIVTKNYGAEVQNMDFAAPFTLEYINKWASDKTHGMISPLLEKIDEKAVSYIMNALYFKGTWSTKFEKENTWEDIFTKESGEQIPVMMMNQVGNFRHNGNKVFRTLCIPYGNGSYQMVMLLPEAGSKISDILSMMDGKKWQENLDGCQTGELNVKIPKFSIEYSKRMNDPLKELGMRSMFDSNLATFPKFCNTGVFVSEVFQKAKIVVDEEGTEAAAVTVIGMSNSAGSDSNLFYADHPFLYAIVEQSTGTIFFMGQYAGN